MAWKPGEARDDPLARAQPAAAGELEGGDELEVGEELQAGEELQERARMNVSVAPDRRSLLPADIAPGSGERLMSLRLPARPDRLKLIRQAVDAAARYCGCGDDCVADIVMAVDEACQNVIRHAYGGADGDILIDLCRDGDVIVVHLIDFAQPTDPDVVKPRALDDIRPGGLGTYLIGTVMDEVGFAKPPEGCGNLFVMKKRIG